MRFPHIKILATLAFGFNCVSIIWAQTVYWSPSEGTMQQGKANAIDLVYDSCEPDGEPDLTPIRGLKLEFRGQSSSQTIINGRRSSKVLLNFQAIALQKGTVTIPSYRVKTSQGEIQVPAARFEVVEATVGNTGISPDDVFMSVFQNRNEKIYAGQVFELEYIAGAKQEYQLADLSAPNWAPTELVTSGLVDKQVSQITYQGDQYLAKVYTAKAIATEAGTKQLPAASQEATVIIGRKRNFMFQEPVYDAFTIQSDPFSLEILPLPEGAPDTFTGAVGQFTLESRIVPEQVQIGEPVTWTLELSGAGNWPASIGVPARSVSSRFKAIQPEIRSEFAEDDLFLGSQSEDIVLIPTEAGSFEFGPVKYTYFDPTEEKYKTITIPATTVTVAPASAGNPALSEDSSGGDASFAEDESRTYTLDPTGENVFRKEPQLLKEPAKTLRSSPAPSKNIHLIQPTLVALAAPLWLWFSFALIRSFVTDPKKSQREALAELRKISGSPLPSDTAKLKQLHLRWRHAAGRYFDLSSEEPTPAEIHRAAESLRAGDFAQKWSDAWKLSDQTLYGKAAADQGSWHDLIKQISDLCPGKHYAPTLVFKTNAWLPCLAVLLVFSLSPAKVSAQTSASAEELYQEGKFAEAAAKWSAAINEAPEVFEHRYNAGLAYAQTGNWSKAWGLWTSAYCLDPSSTDLAWNLRIAHQKTSAYDPVLQALITGESLYKIVSLLAPARWQRLAFEAIWAMGILLSLAIVARYFRPTKSLTAACLVLSLFAGLLAYFSQWSHSKYEALGEPDTLLVLAESPLLTVPTDLQTDQISTTVGEGSVAKRERTFLGWIKITLPNGESGWLRREKTMPLYGKISQT